MKLTWEPLTVRAKYRFATSQGGSDEKHSLFVKLEHEGIVGWGDVVASRLYGQSLEACEAVLQDVAGRLGDDPFRIEPIVTDLLKRHDGQRAAIAAIESALYDWCGKKLGVPVWKMLGLERPRVRTTFTIGVASFDEMRIKTDEALADGYTALKVKVGLDQDEDVLAMIRERFNGPLYLDANEAWTPATAPQRIRALARFNPTLIEQPLPKNEWREMAALRSLGVAPILADESCERPSDVVKLQGCVDGINIKFTKCGGIREALRMVSLARLFGMQIMLGCFFSSGLAIVPSLTIASLVDHADLDGHLLSADDPFHGIHREGSMLSLGDTPGLGLTRG